MSAVIPLTSYTLFENLLQKSHFSKKCELSGCENFQEKKIVARFACIFKNVTFLGDFQPL